MIDEDLYQQAADELNTDQRRPHLWARACALASDDHDEARFLYTNLRVEELIAERETSGSSMSNNITEEADATLGLAPLDETLANAALTDEEIPSSVSTPSGIDRPEANSEGLQLEPLNADALADLDITDATPDLAQDPDAELMADYVAENHDVLDDTYSGDEIAEAEFEQELESFKAEQADNHAQDDTGAILGDLSHDDTALSETFEDELHKDTAELIDNIDLDQPPADQVVQASLDESMTLDDDLNSSHSETAEFTLAQPGDLTQANLNVLEAHTDELDSMLENTKYDPDQASESEADLDWLDAEVESQDEADKVREPREPLIIDGDLPKETDPLTDELTRQADELDLGDKSDDTADFSQQIAEQLTSEDSFSQTEESFSQTLDEPEQTQDASEPDALPAAAAIAASSALAVSCA